MAAILATPAVTAEIQSAAGIAAASGGADVMSAVPACRKTNQYAR
jgi:hypothetical protein